MSDKKYSVRNGNLYDESGNCIGRVSDRVSGSYILDNNYEETGFTIRKNIYGQDVIYDKNGNAVETLAGNSPTTSSSPHSNTTAKTSSNRSFKYQDRIRWPRSFSEFYQVLYYLIMYGAWSCYYSNIGGKLGCLTGLIVFFMLVSHEKYFWVILFPPIVGLLFGALGAGIGAIVKHLINRR